MNTTTAACLRVAFRAPSITRSYALAARPRMVAPSPKTKAKRSSNPKSHPSTSPTIECDEHQTLTLPDSRKLGYSEYGPSNAPVLLYFHGFPGSRIDARVVAGTKIRVIGIDRPGIGLSTFQKNRKLVDWPADVKHLVQHLGIQSFRIMGVSGGGPYALACAKAFPKDVLKATGVLAGSAPIEIMTGGLQKNIMRRTWLSREWRRGLLRLWTWWCLGRKMNSRRAAVQIQLLRSMAADMGHDGELSQDVVNALREPFRQGGSGYVEDSLILLDQWGFELEDVKAKNVMFWYGEEDHNTPIQFGYQMANKVEGATLTAFPNETHSTLLANHEEEILRELMEAGK